MTHFPNRVFLIVITMLMLLLVQNSTHAREWSQIVAAAEGQTVYFNGWGGSEVIRS